MDTKKSIRGTQTEQNLLKAFAGESQAWQRYTIFGKVARKEGYELIGKFFDNTAYNEKHHAKVFFGFLEGGMVEITAAYPAGVIGTTAENLKEAATGEHDEGHVLYPEFAKVAEEEGFKEIAAKFRLIAAVEKEHEKRYQELLKTLNAGELFKKEKPQTWRCSECGHIHEGTTAPDKCPICGHPQPFFQIENDKF
ncbi:MAG: rubrerythrin family protein [Rikenella sp.]|nr:rubrerythrin family protein [Rikenella sp.]